MAGTSLTVVGNLVKDPELRYLPDGSAVANFGIASTPRYFDKTKNAWVDGEALFLWCTAWRDLAERVCESLTKGDRCVVMGELKQRSYETATGEKRSVIELQVDEVAASVRFASVAIRRISRGAPAQAPASVDEMDAAVEALQKGAGATPITEAKSAKTA